MSKRYGLYLTERRQAVLGPKPMRRILQLIDQEIARVEQHGPDLVEPDAKGTFLAACTDCNVQFAYAGSRLCNQCLEVNHNGQ